MKTHRFPFRFAAPLLLVALLGLSACDSSVEESGEFATEEVADVFSIVTEEIGLSAAQQSDFAASLQAHDHEGRTPGYLWIVADSLFNTLTPEQIDRLIERTSDYEFGEGFRGLFGFPGGGGYYGLGGFRGTSPGGGLALADDVLNLTDDQKAAIRELHEAYREALRALMQSRRDGTLEAGTFLSELQALRDALHADIDAILTDEQKAALEAYRAEKEAEFEAFKAEVIAVRNEVLGLTDEEADAYDAILADQLEAREVLLEQFQAGELTFAELNDEITALIDAKNEALQALLTEDQYTVVQIHDALIVRIGKRGHFARFRNQHRNQHRRGPGN